MDTITTTSRKPCGRLRLAIHANKTPDDKRAILKRANGILGGGYTLEVVERRTHININDLRAWAEELNFPFKGAKKPAKYQNANA